MKPLLLAAFIAYQIAGVFAAWQMAPSLFGPMIQAVEREPRIFMLGLCGLEAIVLLFAGCLALPLWAICKMRTR